MADPINPNDPFAPQDPYRQDPTRLDNALQPDPARAGGPVNVGRITIFALSLVVVLGAVYYGLNNTAMAPDAAKTATSAPANNAPTNNMADSGSSKPAVPPGVRDVTPRSGQNTQNTQPGMTTGAAPPLQLVPPENSPPGTTVDPSRTGTSK